MDKVDRRSQSFVALLALIGAVLGYGHSLGSGIGGATVGALCGSCWALGVIAIFTPRDYLSFCERKTGMTGWPAALSPLALALLAFVLVKVGFAFGFLIDSGFWNSIWVPAMIFNLIGNLRTTSHRLFGGGDQGAERARKAQHPRGFPTTGKWVDIGLLSDMRRNLIDRANQILTSLGRGGDLSSIVVMEPYPGDWGQTAEEHHGSALKALMLQLENYENPDDSGVILGGPRGQQKPSESEMFKEGQREAQGIKHAMERETVRFLIGTLSNRCKVIAVLLLQ